MNEVSMNSTPKSVTAAEIDQVINLVDTLYSSKNTDEQAEANRRLTEIQSSDKAWQICWSLLDTQYCRSKEVHFFAANALQLKINQNWAQQDEEWLEKELRPKLFEILLKYASSPEADRLIIERLSLALATFALRSIPTFWPEAIENILMTFNPQNLNVNISSTTICEILLKILAYIPEEYSISMPQQEHKAKLNSQITKAGPIVFKFLHSLLLADKTTISTDCKQNVIKCLTNWTIHSRTSLLEVDDGGVILDILYNFISDEELCCSACSALAATFSTQKAENYRTAVIEFLPKLAGLKHIIDRYKQEDEIECVIKVYSLVINFSENHSRLFLRVILRDGVQLESLQKEELMKQCIFTIIKIILECTSAPGIYGMDEKYSDLSFPFWFNFLENFYYYSGSFNDILCETFDPLVDSLLQTLMVKARFPPSSVYTTWTDDQKDSYRCYRQDIADNIAVLVHFPRARDRILECLGNQLGSELINMLQNSNKDGKESWQIFESNVYALKSISELVSYDEAKVMPSVFTVLAQVPYADYQPELYCTVTEMISSYSDWLFSHNTHLAIAFNILFIGVSSGHSQVRLMSTLSLKDLTSECQTVLQPFAPQIVKSCTDAITKLNNNLTTREKSRLMHTIGTTLATSPADLVAQSLTTLTVPIIEELFVKVRADLSVDPTCRLVIYDRLTMLNGLIESLYIKEDSGHDYEDGDENDPRLFDRPNQDLTQETEVIQPALGLLSQIIPILTIISSKYGADEEIMSILSNTIKRSAKSLGIMLKPLVKDFLIIIVNAYDPLLNSTILEGNIPLYNLFRSDESLHSILYDAFERIGQKTIEACVRNPLRQMANTIENYFKYSTHVCKKLPNLLASAPPNLNVELIYNLAVASLELPERRTLIEVCNFLCLFKQKSIGDDKLHSIFVSNLNMMLSNIFNIFGGNYSTPRNAIEQVYDVLFVIVELDEAKEPIKIIIEKENFPTTYVNCDHKARFFSKILREKNRKKFRESCYEFVLLARNLSRST